MKASLRANLPKFDKVSFEAANFYKPRKVSALSYSGLRLGREDECFIAAARSQRTGC